MIPTFAAIAIRVHTAPRTLVLVDCLTLWLTNLCMPADGAAPDGLGAYSRRAVSWIEGVYVTLRPSFSDKDTIYVYRTEILWDEAASCLIFREAERMDAAFTQSGQVSMPNQSGHIYLVTNDHGQFRLITLGRATITGQMYGLLSTLQSGAGGRLTPVAAPIARNRQGTVAADGGVRTRLSAVARLHLPYGVRWP